MEQFLNDLQQSLDLAIAKKSGSRTSSLAYSKHGNIYKAGSIASDNHLLDISSEQISLCLATQANDFGIEKVVTMLENAQANETASPLIIKVLIDYQRRVGTPIEYTVVDTHGEELFSIKNIGTSFPAYTPQTKILERVTKAQKISPNRTSIGVEIKNHKKILKEHAIKGFDLYFPTEDSGSRYGAAVLTKNGRVFFAGGYSSFEHRLSIHPEMVSIISALSAGEREITHLGVVSTKYEEDPVELCGCCRQFVAEMNTKFCTDIAIHCFAFKSSKSHSYTIDTYLPRPWTSKKW